MVKQLFNLSNFHVEGIQRKKMSGFFLYIKDKFYLERKGNLSTVVLFIW